jgi:hypothetical protein
MDRSVAQISDELYALPPQAFTAARDTYAAQARQSGDAAAAKELAALKRPTIVGFLVNLLALRRPADVERLLSLSGQAAVGGAALRELATQRRREMDTLLRVAVELAAGSGVAEPTRGQLAEVESTLSAALVDEQAAALVRTGRVLKGLSYGGFGSWGPTTSAGPALSVKAGPPVGTDTDQAGPSAGADTAPAQSDEAARQQALDRLAVAEQVLAQAYETEQSLSRRGEQLAADIERLKEQLTEVERAGRAARQTRLTAERELASARRRAAKF